MISLDSKSQPLHLDVALSARADDYVQQGAGGRSKADTHPFRRKVDFWVLAVAYADFLGLEPAEESPSNRFVLISKNPKEGPSLPEDVQMALIALHITANRDVEVDDLDLSPRSIIDTADRYAAVGAPKLLERLQDHLNDMDVLPYQGMAEMLVEDHAIAQEMLDEVQA